MGSKMPMDAYLGERLFQSTLYIKIKKISIDIGWYVVIIKMNQLKTAALDSLPSIYASIT